jgi:hypothetical protein
MVPKEHFSPDIEDISTRYMHTWAGITSVQPAWKRNAFVVNDLNMHS